jgi:2-amino-4-hydroxy-6-hydroxymethyldihydropteridine diphosphokinase
MGLQIAYLSAGSNLGDRKENLESAFVSLREAGATPSRISSYFETEPVGFREQPWFINVALEVETRLTPSELLATCQAIEAARGRVRSFENAPRILDLDILFYGDLMLNNPGLVIPHPRLAERRFVLEPLARIAPDLVHPVFKKSIRSLLEICPDCSMVRIYSPGDPP